MNQRQQRARNFLGRCLWGLSLLAGPVLGLIFWKVGQYGTLTAAIVYVALAALIILWRWIVMERHPPG
jgi:membrane protein DedA with SNARE-associated domain